MDTGGMVYEIIVDLLLKPVVRIQHNALEVFTG